MVCEIMLWMVRGYVTKKFCCMCQVIGNLINLKVNDSASIYVLIEVNNQVVQILVYISKWRSVHNLAEVCFVATIHTATTATSIFF